jgi:hypothetical protein
VARAAARRQANAAHAFLRGGGANSPARPPWSRWPAPRQKFQTK